MSEPTVDPWAVLGLEEDAGDEAIRLAYLAKVKAHPPDRDPAEFEKIRDAYATLKDPSRRLERLLLHADPLAPLAGLLDAPTTQRRFAGPHAWLAALEEA